MEKIASSTNVIGSDVSPVDYVDYWVHSLAAKLENHVKRARCPRSDTFYLVRVFSAYYTCPLNFIERRVVRPR
jgi:hypothetical protein